MKSFKSQNSNHRSGGFIVSEKLFQATKLATVSPIFSPGVFIHLSQYLLECVLYYFSRAKIQHCNSLKLTEKLHLKCTNIFRKYCKG